MIFLLACFPFGTTAHSLLLKLLKSNGQDCKYTGGRSFHLYFAGKLPFCCNSISICFHQITVFKKQLGLTRRAIVSGLTLEVIGPLPFTRPILRTCVLNYLKLIMHMRNVNVKNEMEKLHCDNMYFLWLAHLFS